MIVITGATGNIGSKTTANLLAQGKKVKALGRDANKLAELELIGAQTATGELNDTEFLTKEFTGAEAVLLIIPSFLQAADVKSYQDAIGEAQITAIKNSGVKNVVFISSQGAHDLENTGIITGLGRQEIRLNNLPTDVNVLSLRPASFMENLFNQIGLIKSMNIMGSPG